MTVNQKPSGRASSMPAGLMAGLTVSLGVTLLLAVVSAKLVDIQWIGEKDIGYCAMVILMLAPFTGARAAQRKIKRQRLLVSLMSGGLYFLMLMGITALFFGGQYEAVGVTMLLVAGGTGLTLLTGEGNSGVGKRRKKKLYNR